MNSEVNKFQALRRLVSCFKNGLSVLEEIRDEHDSCIEKLLESFVDIELFIKEKYSVDVDLQHLIKHAEFFDEERFQYWRKKILDHGNSLKREIEEI